MPASALKQPRTPLSLWLLMALYAAVGYAYSITRLVEFKTPLFDLAAFNQVMHAIVTTGLPTTTLTPRLLQENWLGFHFSPILYALAPLYALFPAPQTLQAVQVACIAFAAWPLYRALLRLAAPPKQAWLWSALYLINPFTLNALVWDFHENALAVPLIAFGLWAVAAGRFRGLLACCGLLLLVKEHYGLAVAGFGLLWGMQYGQWRRGLWLAAGGLVAMALILFVAMPWFCNGCTHLMLDESASAAAPRYQWLLSLEGRRRVLPALSAQWPAYAVALLLPFCLLPPAGRQWLLPALGDMAAFALSENDFCRSPFSYHNAGIIPVLAVAGYLGSVRLARLPALSGGQARLGNYALILSAISGWLLAPLPLPLAGNVWELGLPHLTLQTGDAAAIDAIRQRLSDGAPTATQRNIGVWFSDAPHLFAFPYPPASVTRIVLKLDFPYRQTQIAMGTPYGMPPKEFFAQTEMLLNDPAWGVVYWNAPWLVLERNAGGKPAGDDIKATVSTLEETCERLPAP